MNQKKQWSDRISNAVLCNFFYIFFVIFSIFAALSLLGGIYMFTMSNKMTFPMLFMGIFNIIMTFGISGTSALFLYLICDRALKPQYDGYQSNEFKDMGEGFAEDGFAEDGFAEGYSEPFADHDKEKK
jgi:hypothetical protein